jgi:hypothetical protein
MQYFDKLKERQLPADVDDVQDVHSEHRFLRPIGSSPICEVFDLVVIIPSYEEIAAN